MAKTFNFVSPSTIGNFIRGYMNLVLFFSQTGVVLGVALSSPSRVGGPSWRYWLPEEEQGFLMVQTKSPSA